MVLMFISLMISDVQQAFPMAVSHYHFFHIFIFIKFYTIISNKLYEHISAFIPQTLFQTSCFQKVSHLPRLEAVSLLLTIVNDSSSPHNPFFVMTLILTHFPPLFHHAPHEEPATLRYYGSFLHTLLYFSASTPMHLQHCCQVNSLLKNHNYFIIGPSLVALTVKNLPAMQKTWVRSLGQEDPLEKGMATHSSILAWRIPWTEEPGGL